MKQPTLESALATWATARIAAKQLWLKGGGDPDTIWKAEREAADALLRILRPKAVQEIERAGNTVSEAWLPTGLIKELWQNLSPMLRTFTDKITGREPASTAARICITVSPRSYDRYKALIWWWRNRTSEICVGGPGQRLWLFGRFWLEREQRRTSVPLDIDSETLGTFKNLAIYNIKVNGEPRGPQNVLPSSGRAPVEPLPHS